jgi:hypothetical protein
VIPMYLAAVVVLLLAFLLGQAALNLCGYRDHAPLAPVVGFSMLLIVATGLISLPGHTVTAAAGILVLGAGSFWLQPRPRVDRSSLAIIILTVAGSSIPFVANGRFGILGQSVNDDLASHLLWTFGLESGGPGHALVPSSYPIGPHSLAATLAKVLPGGVDASFTALIVVVPVITAATALAVLIELPPRVRVPAGVLVGLPYLGAAYLAQGSFKEPMHGLLILGFALLVREVRHAPVHRLRRFGPLAAVVPAALLVRGWPAMGWFGLLAAFLVLAARIQRRSAAGCPPGGTPRARILATGAVALAIAILPQAGRLLSFRPAFAATDGNVPKDVPAVEVLGIWPTGDFRGAPAFDYKAIGWIAVALVMLIYALFWWVQRMDLEIPSTFLACAVIYLAMLPVATAYFAAKVLVAAASVTMLMLTTAVFSSSRRSPPPRWRYAVGAVFCLGAIWSTFLALRDAPVGPTERANELAEVRSVIRGRPTLYLPADNFGRWKARGATLSVVQGYSPSERERFQRRGNKPLLPGGLVDFDSVDAAMLDRFEFAISSRSPFASEPPPNWRLVRQTASYQLWARSGPTPARRVLEDGHNPGAVLDCENRQEATRSEQAGAARVRPAPIVGPGWRHSAPEGGDPTAVFVIPSGASAEQTLDLPAGAWDISFQYVSSAPLRIRSPGLRANLPASLDVLGAFWSAGTLHSTGGPATVRIEVGAGRLGFSPARRTVLGLLAATRIDTPPETVPLSTACGRYVDWYEPRASDHTTGVTS